LQEEEFGRRAQSLNRTMQEEEGEEELKSLDGTIYKKKSFQLTW
jgi:hypothetical protein